VGITYGYSNACKFTAREYERNYARKHAEAVVTFWQKAAGRHSGPIGEGYRRPKTAGGKTQEVSFGGFCLFKICRSFQSKIS